MILAKAVYPKEENNCEADEGICLGGSGGDCKVKGACSGL